MALKSFAKINLTLNVNKKTKNGLHDIQSIYCLVNKFDTIYIKKTKIKTMIIYLLQELIQNILIDQKILLKRF